MNKRDRLTKLSSKAAQEATEACAAKIQRLTSNELDIVIEEFKKSTLDKTEIDELLKKMENATNRNKVLINAVSINQKLCQVVKDIIAKID